MLELARRRRLEAEELTFRTLVGMLELVANTLKGAYEYGFEPL